MTRDSEMDKELFVIMVSCGIIVLCLLMIMLGHVIGFAKGHEAGYHDGWHAGYCMGQNANETLCHEGEKQ